jgi:hypothetical protein
MFAIRCSLLGAVLVASCAREEKVVYYKPFFAGLQGVDTRTPGVYDKGLPAGAGGAGSAGAAGDELVVTDKNGKKRLMSGTGVQLMYHIQNLLAKNDADLFADQVLAEATRQEFKERGLDPREAFAALKQDEREIAKLFGRMPMGEHSPNVLMEPLGDNTFRVKVTGTAVKGLDKWVGFDMVLERGNWKLRWFV